MSLRCGGICNNHFVQNFVLSLAVKFFENRLIIREIIDMSRMFFDSQCTSVFSNSVSSELMWETQILQLQVLVNGYKTRS